ncbi:hypothetical protein MASSI9I_50432 [Massilia sp. 9I]|nr:hypothetical protein MASSI9I_50432 [Massilia sp. 9I]
MPCWAPAGTASAGRPGASTKFPHRYSAAPGKLGASHSSPLHHTVTQALALALAAQGACDLLVQWLLRPLAVPQTIPRRRDAQGAARRDAAH